MRKSTTHGSGNRAALVALSAALVLMVRVPLVDAAPDPAAWGQSSGYNALEAQRVAYSALTGAPDAAGADGLYSIEANRAMSARLALSSGDIGSMQEEALTSLVVAADAAADGSQAEEWYPGTGGIR